MNQNDREAAKLITLTAFLIGYVLIDHLNSNEQNALGNFFMLIGQTLCTSGSENFKRSSNLYSNSGGGPNGGRNSPYQNPHSGNGQKQYNCSMSREDTIQMLNRAKDIFSQEIDKLK